MSELEPRRAEQKGLARWIAKFRDAGDGLVQGVATQESLWVHLAFAIAVLAVAAGLRLEAWRWAVLLLCITVVIASELFNSAIEQLARVLHPRRERSIAVALHMAAAGVLVAASGAVVVGLVVLGPPLWQLLGG